MADTSKTATAETGTREEQRTSDGLFLVREVERLARDPEFNERYRKDPELNRLMSDRPEEADRNAEDLATLGMSVRIAGVDIAPVRLGHFRVLTAVGNEFAKAKQDWSRGFEYQLGQIAEALFVLRYGARCVTEFADYFRWRRVITTWGTEAKSNPALLPAVLDAERKAAAGLKAWDAAVLRFSEREIVLAPGETLVEVVQKIDGLLAGAFLGFDLLPKIKQPDDEKRDGAAADFFGLRRWRRLFARGFVRLALRLIRRRSGGE